MANPFPSERRIQPASSHGSNSRPAEGTDNILFRLPHYDLVSFLAISERIPSLQFYTFAPDFRPKDQLTIKGGASGLVHDIALSSNHGIIFKRYKESSRFENFKAIIAEIMVLKHPVFAKHPNIVDLDGITWDVEISDEQPPQVTPVLVFRRAEHGTLAEFLRSSSGRGSSLGKRLRLCTDIGLALEAIHAFGMSQ